jgi:3-phytase
MRLPSPAWQLGSALCLAGGLWTAVVIQEQPPGAIAHTGSTVPVPHDPDDPAIWLHPTDPGQSLILATDKVAATGGLHVFGLDGIRRQSIEPMDRPNNVDVEYDVPVPGGRGDIAVVTERMQHRLRLFLLPADGGPLVDLVPSGLRVLEGADGSAGEPMGVSLYRRPRDGAVFVIVSPKGGGPVDYLWQYRLDAAARPPSLVMVRRFGAFTGAGPDPGDAGEIEAVVADDELGYVYYADERFAIRKWHADPEHPDAGRELAVFGTEGYIGDREGLAVYRQGDGTGYLVSSDQVAGGSRLMIYPREGVPGSPHTHPLIAVVPTPSDETDGLDVTARALPGFPRGLLVMMNSAPRNFLLFGWDAVAARLPRPTNPPGAAARE